MWAIKTAACHSLCFCFCFSTYGDEKTKKAVAEVILRPFTPMHSCIISPSLPEAHVEVVPPRACLLHCFIIHSQGQMTQPANGHWELFLCPLERDREPGASNAVWRIKITESRHGALELNGNPAGTESFHSLPSQTL